ncbi:uncharacterized protein si:ch211-269k10.4 [Ictalurus punctatus]|uniref:Uncharacterized protein si:ch211-269k10.4 n=1 Tax=Ictalurus punctatus TaxID=7998 RepID=A0A2D0PPJ7_ICTPU|nr:uncharacterized protein si:ch211-269k10.4 [Ictalurus punctatus]
MACVNLSMDVMEDHSARRGHREDEGPLIKHYRVSELIPAPELPLHQLLKREPAVWAAVQISSGVLSIGLGVMFAVSFPINHLFLILFRVPIITGILFLIAGLFSMLLYRHPTILQMCFHSNIFCLVVAAIGAVLLCVDLAEYNAIRDPVKQEKKLEHEVEILVLCVTLLDMLVSTVLILLINAEKRRHEKK